MGGFGSVVLLAREKPERRAVAGVSACGACSSGMGWDGGCGARAVGCCPAIVAASTVKRCWRTDPRVLLAIAVFEARAGPEGLVIASAVTGGLLPAVVVAACVRERGMVGHPHIASR